MAATASVTLRQRLGWLGGGLLGIVLLIAAYAKLLDPLAFAEQLQKEGFALPGGLEALGGERLLAWVALAVEVGLGLALLLGVRTRAVLVSTTLLVLLFLFLTGRTYARDLRGLPIDDGSCGCFGNLVERTPAEAFWQDLLLLVPGWALVLWGAGGAPGAGAGASRAPRRLAVAAVAGVIAGGFAVVSPSLPLDDLATRARPGQQIAALCAGREAKRVCLSDAVAELRGGGSGGRWVVVADLADPRFVAATARLNEYSRRAEAEEHPLLVLTSSTPEEQRSFFWEAAPAFEIREVPKSLLRPLYRQLPRSFRVENGTIVETAAGLAPFLR